MFDKKQILTIEVPGMHCAHCSARAEKCLLAVPGVKKADVSLEKGTAQVTVAAGKVTAEQLEQAVRQAGFVKEA